MTRWTCDTQSWQSTSWVYLFSLDWSYPRLLVTFIFHSLRIETCLYLIPTLFRRRLRPFSGRGLSSILVTSLYQLESRTLLAKSHFPGPNCRPSRSTGGSLRASRLLKPLRVQCSMCCFTINIEFLTRISISTRECANLNCPWYQFNILL